MSRSIPFILVLITILTACGREEPGARDAVDARELLRKSEQTLDSLTSAHYTMMYSVKPAGTDDTTNSIYEVVLQPLPGNPFGYRLFARSLSGYHAVYDGDTAILGVPDSVMTIYAHDQNPAQRLDLSFAGNTRISYVHGKTIFDGVRNSSNITGMDAESFRWRDGKAYRLRIRFGARPPITGGTLEIILRASDCFPVRVTETLEVNTGGRVQTQYYAAELTGIELDRPLADGQFSRAALPPDTRFRPAEAPAAVDGRGTRPAQP